MSDLTRLTALRHDNRGAATRLVNKINDIIADTASSRAQKVYEFTRKIADLETKITVIEGFDNSIFNEVDAADLAIEMETADSNNQTLRDARDGFDFQLQTLREAEAAANATLVPAPIHPPINIAPDPSASALPKLDLPSFKGDLLLWFSFWDVFEAEVDAKSYSGATKFNFLVSKLEGEAKAALLGLTSSNDNYTKAKDLLRERYSQPKTVVTAQYKALINLPVAAATCSSLRSFADQLESHMRDLEAFGTAPTSYGNLLVCLVDKLAFDVRRNLTRHQGTAEWTLDELRTAIQREIDIMGDICDQIPQTPRPALKQVLSATSQQSLQQSHPVKKRSCPFCADAHSPSNCMEFKSPEDRMKAVKLKKLCSNCLGVKHSSFKDCQSQIRCFRCHQMHHTSLHNKKGSINQPKPSTSHTGCLLSIASSKTLANKDLLAPSDEKFPFVFLKTAIATVSSHVASFLRANLLIDEGSQLTFITARHASKLRLRPMQQVLLSGFKGLSTPSTEPNYYDAVSFLLHCLNGERITIRAVVLNAIVEPVEDPHRAVLSSLPHPQHLQLAHPTTTDGQSSVDILIGADSY